MNHKVNFAKMPTHIAIIPDGNRRWARSKGSPDLEGHRKGLNTAIQLVKDSRDFGIKYLTLWFFSTENWKRSKKEVNYLMRLALRFFDKQAEDLVKNEVRFRHLGRKDRIPAKLDKKFCDLENKTKDFTKHYLNLAFDYGGREEIVRAVKKIVELKIAVDDINDNVIENNLYTEGIPDPDLVIRTSGEQRLSGYLLWQCAYAELYFPKVYFPDFDAQELKKAIEVFQGRDRRFGGNSAD